MALVLYRFTRDLRLEDHAGLAQAASHGAIVPVIVIDRLLQKRVEVSPRRAAFFVQAVDALDAALRERGSRLIVRRGPLLKTMLNLVDQIGAGTVVWSASYDAEAMDEDSALRAALEERGVRAPIVHDAPAIPPEETSAEKLGRGDGYRAFVPYLDVWRSLEIASHEAPLLLRFADVEATSEALPDRHEFGAASVGEGATPHAALALLTRFLQQDVLQYHVAVGVPADGRTSRLSPHLSFGTIAARTVVRETKRRAEDPFLLAEERASLRRFLRSIAQRDFFLQLSWYHPQTQRDPLQTKMRAFPLPSSHEHLSAWKEGKTGFPLVDAGIRQLRATGWMHPQVRLFAASFLCFDLDVDWRIGVEEWDRHLIEDEPALAAGNWQWVAGVGADLAAYPRIYNPVKGARRVDPDGVYARTWIPELEGGVPALPQSLQPALPLFGQDGYPAPILDHNRAARQYLQRYGTFLGASAPGDAPRANR